ncbi:MAG: ArgR family transcriptional regulator [Coriobacteriales bacterium]|jgi:transcriptional regulator of arginine metabolism|nr:ArgR family transcriptional regulator [Coriobacteriales bacterium]
MKKRLVRQDAIKQLIRQRTIRTQRDLVAGLEDLGFNCTQATVSRDINEMNLRKLPEGVYILPEDLLLQRLVSDLVSEVTVAQNLVVIKTAPGSAQGVAAALESAGEPKVIGLVAGDDTILVVAADNNQAEAFETAVNKLRLH